MKTSQFNTKKVFIIIEDDLVFNNFKDDFYFYFLKDFVGDITLSKDFDIDSIFNKAAHLSYFGWKKEAIPILQTKKSLITRIFKSIFE